MKRFNIPLVVSTLLLGSLLFFYGCTLIDNDDDDKTNELAAAALVLNSSSSGQSAGATAAVPESLSGSTAAVSSSTRTVITDTTAATDLKGTYAPVRSSVRIARDIIDLAKKFITELETGQVSKITKFPSSFSYTDSSDKVSTTKIVKISQTTTFGGTGKKLEIWWKQNANSTVTAVKTANVKQLEFEYYKASGDVSTDGVMYFRFLDSKDSTNLTIGRAEYKKDSTTGTKITQVHLQSLTDVIQSTGSKTNAAFYVSEDSTGLVNIDGVIEMTGIKMPFKDDNTTDATNWGTTTKRAYIYKGIGSDNTNHAVVKVILPKTGEESGDNPFADAKAWSLGELYTTGFLQAINGSTLNSINTNCGGTSITTSSNQAALTSALTTWDSKCGTDATNKANISRVKAVTGIKNPVFFLKNTSTNTNDLIGQENVDGLSTVSGANVGTYSSYISNTTFSSNSIRNNTDDGGNFTSSGISVLNILDGTSVAPIKGHSSSIKAWTGNADAIPTDVTATSLK